MVSTLQSVESKLIKVNLLLVGGHQYTIHLKSEEPLLRNLLSVMVARSQRQLVESYGLFQIPIEGGNAALCFPGEHLVALVTEPPVFIQQPETVQPQPKAAIASNYVQIDHFLTPAEHQKLLNFVLQQEPNFVPTTTSSNDADYRRSMVLHSFPEFSQLLTSRVQAVMPEVFRQLKLAAFPVAQIEAQLTSHNDGNYYKIHNDNGSPDTATREFTYVYYFYREPKAFSGGELRVYDSKVENGFYVAAESFKTVEPRNNSIVFFASRYLHEVLPVQCPSKAFADSRFTINGWVRRQAASA